MRDYDSWIFGMLWEIEHRGEPRRSTDSRLARQVMKWQAAASPGSGVRRTWSRLGQLVGSSLNCARLRLRGQAAKVS